jgi:hypothetical protein
MPIVLNGTTGITTPTYNGSTTAEYLVPVTGFKNRIINGDMGIDQRNNGASFSSSANGAYNLDRWYNQNNSSGTRFTVQQNAGSVTPPAGFRNYLGVTSTSSYSVASTDVIAIGQKIEGFNTADLMWGTANASPITFSFWVRSSLTGTFGGSVSNNDGNRFYAYTYTISAANTWEQKTVSLAGDTTGTWNITNGAGIQLLFNLGTGATYSGAAGSWTGSPFYAPTGATSVVGTNGATFYITGVQLEKGSNATSFDYLPYGTELALCQRYFEKTYSQSVALGSNTSEGSAQSMSPVNLGGVTYGTTFQYKVTKRATPTITGYLPSGASGQWFTGVIGSSEAAGTFTAQNIGDTGFRPTATSSGSPNSIYGQLAISAEL